MRLDEMGNESQDGVNADTHQSGPEPEENGITRREFVCGSVIAAVGSLIPACLNPEKPKQETSNKKGEQPKPQQIEVKTRYPERELNLKYKGRESIKVWHPEYLGDLEYVVVYFHGNEKNTLWDIIKKLPYIKRKKPRRNIVEKVWKEGQLKSRFKASGIPGLFVVPQSASSNDEMLQTDVVGVLDEVERGSGIKTGNKKIIIIGSSFGGFTVPYWTYDPRVTTVITCDAMYYKSLDEFLPKRLQEWVKFPGNRLFTVSIQSSRDRHNEFLQPLNTQTFPDVPKFSQEICGLQAIHIASNKSHGEAKSYLSDALRLNHQCPEK